MRRNFLLACCMLIMIACNEQLDDSPIVNDYEKKDLHIEEKNMYLREFSEILSKAVAQNKDVREFLKSKALERIDNDYNVFYPIIKDELINGQTFESILAQYAECENSLPSITTAIPLLNIHIPELLDNKVTDLDTDDDIPILNGNALYFDGQLVDTLARDEIPAFQLLVVTESSTIRQRSGLSKSMNNLLLNSEYEYVDEVFNPNHIRKPIKKASGYESYSPAHSVTGYFLQSSLDGDLVNAYNISKDKKEATRAVMYYKWSNIKDNKTDMRSDVKDCIFRFRLNLTGFDAYESTSSTNHAFLNSNTHKKTSLSREDALYSLLRGEVFKIKFIIECNSHTQEIPSKTIICYVQPKHLYDFYIKEDYKHSTVFGRHSRYTYTLDRERTQPKWYYPMEHGEDTRLERWDLTQDPINKTIKVYIENKDAGVKMEKTDSYTQTISKGGKIGGKVEFSKFITAGINGEFNSSNTVEHTVTLKYSYTPEDLFIGDVEVKYFKDFPIEDITNGKVNFTDVGSGELTLNVIPVTNNYWNRMQYKTLY